MSANRHDIKVLNSLVTGLIDCSEGYRDTANHVLDPRYSQWFERRANERMELADALKAEIRARGGSPEEKSSILSKAHRAFAGFTQAVLGNQSSLFETVRTSEAQLKSRFMTAIANTGISATTREIIRRGLEQVITSESDLAALSEYLEPHSPTA